MTLRSTSVSLFGSAPGARSAMRSRRAVRQPHERVTGDAVPHRGRWVIAGRAEVALALDERIAQRPRLGEPDEGVVDRAVAVRVVTAHDVADDAGALVEAAVGPVAAVVHRVEHAPVHRLEPVAHVGQRARHDDAHRVVEVRPLHLQLQVDRLDPGPPGAAGTSPSSVTGPARSRRLGAAGGRESSSWEGVRCRGSGRPWRCAG